MTVSYSNGDVYESPLHAEMGVKPPVTGDGAEEQKTEKPEKDIVDTDHHVPLVASALMDKDGKMYGMAIDHRLDMNKDQQELLKLHESTELPYMHDLIKGGMSPTDAYAEAHKWATARETAASIAKWGEDGHEAYKDHMREAAKIAAEPSDRDRHPDAHTTVHGLDEHELGYKPGMVAQGLKNLKPEPLDLAKLTGQPSWLDRAKAEQKNPTYEGTKDLASGFGVAGTFEGARGAYATAFTTGEIGNLEKAIQLESQGMPKNRPSSVYGDLKGYIRDQTGWFRGPDNKWRFEIPDEHADLNLQPLLRKSTASLEDVFTHDELFQAYPWLKDLKVSTDIPKGFEDSWGIWDPKTSTFILNMNRGSVEDIKSTLLHEIQHSIQDFEGFARGANYNHYIPQDQMPEGMSKEEKEAFETRGVQQYLSSMGETESRNVQTRMNYDKEMRALIHPWESQDIPTHMQRPGLSSIRTIATQRGGAGGPGGGVPSTLQQEELKKKLIDLTEQGKSIYAIAKELGYSKSAIDKWQGLLGIKSKSRFREEPSKDPLLDRLQMDK